MTDAKGSTSCPDMHVLQKQWDEACCAICMDHPHNAVLLICTSHEKGCRSYICDTSYRHSNCLDRFKKVRIDHISDSLQPTSSFPEDSVTERPNQISPRTDTSEPFLVSPRMRRNTMDTHESVFGALEENNIHLRDRYMEAQVDGRVNLEQSAITSTSDLKCPLCRGTVLGWKIVKEARQYLDLKPRSCSRESCLFSGNYGELRRHARRAHPTTRPAEVDPSRQRAWRNLEHQREYGDILSAIRSAMPGSVVLGDYVIDDGDPLSHDRELGDVNGPWWATLFLFHMMSNRAGLRDEFRGSSRTRSWRTRHSSPGQRNTQGVNLLGLHDDNDDGTFRTWRTRRRSSGRRDLWGENLLGLQDYDDDNDDDDDDDDIMLPRRRRRFARFRSDEEGR